MTSPFTPPEAPLVERFPHGLAWPETWRLRVLAGSHVAGGAFGVLATAAVMAWSRQLNLVALVVLVPFVACIACGARFLRSPLSASDLLRFLLVLQVPHFTLGGVAYEFYMGVLALVAVSGDGNLILRPGGGAGFQVALGAEGAWTVGVNFAPFVFLAWLGRIERALYRIADARDGLVLGGT